MRIGRSTTASARPADGTPARRSARPRISSAMRSSTRSGMAPRAQRLRLAAVGAGAGLAVAAAALAWLARIGPPARLLPGTAAGIAGDGIVVNSQRAGAAPRARPRRPRARARGRRTCATRGPAGIAVPVSRTGVVTCTRRGDAVVRATLGPLVTPVRVHCEPVRELRAAFEGDFVLGDSGRDLAADAVGVDGRPVTRLAARLRRRGQRGRDARRRARPPRLGREDGGGDARRRTAARGPSMRVFEPVRQLRGDPSRPAARGRAGAPAAGRVGPMGRSRGGGSGCRSWPVRTPRSPRRSPPCSRSTAP